MSNGIEIKNLPSATTIKQNDTMTIVQDKENKQLSLDVFANESDLTTLTPLEARCDEVKAKIEVDEYSAEITTSQSMSEIGSDDNGANLHENVLDGAYESCVLKGKTKYIDNDTQEILDTFQDGRNLSLIDVKSPILTNLDANNEQSNTVTFVQNNDKTIVLRSLPNGVCDTLNVETGEYIQRIKEVELGDLTWSKNNNWSDGDYLSCYCVTEIVDRVVGMEGMISDKLKVIPRNQAIDSKNNICVQECIHGDTVTTPTVYVAIAKTKLANYELSGGGMKSYLKNNPIKLQYELETPIVKTVDLSGFPHAYKNGHIQLSSGSTEPSLTPTVTYKVPVSRVGQIASNTKSNLRQSIKLDQLEVLVYQSLINTEYENLLVQNSAESATSFRNLSVNDPKDGLYYMLKHLIEENQPVQNMLDKINLFYLYGLLSDEHYFDLLLGGEEDVY